MRMLAKIIRRMPQHWRGRPRRPLSDFIRAGAKPWNGDLGEGYCAKGEPRSSCEPELPDRVRVTVVWS